MRILVTGGCGFIGSAVVRRLLEDPRHEVLNLDKLTYAATEASVASVADSPRYHFVRGDIADAELVRSTFAEFRPEAVMNLAAETHVDRSIDAPDDFLVTNVMGTFRLLEAARFDLRDRAAAEAASFRFLHISTDEVFGALGPDDAPFDERTPYSPRSPYSASKAASDHLVRAWGDTFGVPVLLTNCSNNYGPFHFPEKLIPLTIVKALRGEELPVYGRGDNVRDWLHVSDHAQALVLALERGRPGETYAIGGRSERTNLEVVELICDLLDQRVGLLDGRHRRALIRFVEDRPGHDFRYAIDCSKAEQELGWTAAHRFETGLADTIDWYLANEAWWDPILRSRYDGKRLGTGS